MNGQYALAFWLIFLITVPTLAQQPSASSNAQTQQQGAQQGKREDEDVVRITTNLVQVDAVVTDKNGKPVTDLKPQEIQIYEDNRQQKITHFSYITSDNADVALAKPTPTDKRQINVPMVHLRPSDVRRTIAVVVDDLGLSSQSIYFVRRALKKFIDDQMQPGDLVAIIRTSGGIGALQQFTSDKRELYAALEHIKWYRTGRNGVDALAPIQPPTAGAGGALMDEKAKELDELRNDIFSVGTLGAVSYVIRGLEDLPGRKSILLISEGFKMSLSEPLSREAGMDKNSSNDRTLQKLQKLIDQASRASVVIYTMDTRGLQTLGLTAADNVFGQSREQVEQQLQNRRDTLYDTQAGLRYLADETGGIAIRNSNDLSAGIRKVLDDQKGYYLIGYRPDQSTFDPKTGRRSFHHLTLKVTRPGSFTIRMRKGFFGVSDNERVSAEVSAREQIVHALVSPFGSDAVPIRLTSLFANDAKAGSYMRSLLHVDGNALTFTNEPDDWHQAQFDVVAVTFGDNGNVVDEVSRVDRLRVRGEAYRHVLKSGFVYMMTLPIKKPGAYQLRVALRDQASERVGSASQFVEVPDMKKSRLELSGIMVSAGARAASITQQPQTSGSVNQSSANQSEQDGSPDTATSAAVRRFHQGDDLHYSFVIYNARLRKETNQPQLQTQARLFRNGQPVFTGKLQPFALNNPPDLSRLSADSMIHFGADMIPGEYLLQVVVTDLLADEKHRTATVWLDFEIVK
ncbi:MAG TPA: VWA domain-containing protein [Pyrinomonadaceae bacterium]|nr:VWA domain-containing protein [Pyrinomonadaceae bacterium]